MTNHKYERVLPPEYAIRGYRAFQVTAETESVIVFCETQDEAIGIVRAWLSETTFAPVKRDFDKIELEVREVGRFGLIKVINPGDKIKSGRLITLMPDITELEFLEVKSHLEGETILPDDEYNRLVFGEWK